MGTNTAELINENDAATLARVSTATLARFAEAGYFPVEFSGSERLYPRRALVSVFGVAMEPTAAGAGERENVIPFPHTDRVVAEAAENVLEENARTETPPPVAESAPRDMMENVTTAEPSIPAPQPDSVSNSTHFNSIISMHTDILSRQEREIQDLKAEREWLRRRIEKLEEKAERDQVLLLNEAQTVKQLIQIQSQKKSAIRQTLEWFGIVSDQQMNSAQLGYSATPGQARPEAGKQEG